METLPDKLDALCRQYGICFFDLRIRCVFCNHFCSAVDLAAFHQKSLSLIWKGCVCFACCSCCLTLSAKFELEKYYQCSLSSDYFEDVVQESLSSVVIRCLKCLTKLDYIEKLEHKRNCRPFHLIRGRWRANCRNCAEK
uniref:Protein E6 n=1 Tax=Human papillomavirus TaxID=10566 RepID=A0A385PM59_9PAPI|nr:MAG: E6 protein [Human papillomavirus]